MTPPRSLLPRVAAALTLLPLLSGCVAFVAVPLMTAVGAATEKKRTRAQIVAELPAANAAALAAVPEPTAPGAAEGSVQLTGLTELPPPSGAVATAPGPWQDFAAYALGRASALEADGPALSALLTADSVATFRTRMRPCRQREPAVIVDLDPGQSPFSPQAAGLVNPGVAAAVARLREAGVIVLWVSQASANDVAAVAEALESSGLDPTGRDPILLVRNEEERKQVLREEANDTVCIVAIAGDRRGDFDELFDYLRNPDLATVYDGQIGAGWFIVPPLFAASASAVAPAREDGGG